MQHENLNVVNRCYVIQPDNVTDLNSWQVTTARKEIQDKKKLNIFENQYSICFSVILRNLDCYSHKHNIDVYYAN